MDELMTSSSLDLAWPACQKCLAHVDEITPPRNDFMINDQRDVKHSDHTLELKVNKPAHPLAMPHHIQRSLAGALQLPLEDDMGESMFSEASYRVNRQWNVPSEDEESLEPPLPLRSDMGETQPQITRPTHTPSRMFSSNTSICKYS